MRRRFHLAFALVVLLVTSGCTLPGADLTANAAPVSVNDSTLNTTGYTLDERAPIALNETVGIAGEDRKIGVKNWIAAYESTEHEGRFVVFSTPSPNTEGAPVNPFADPSERRDIARMFGEVVNKTPLRVVNRHNVTMFGERTEVVTYATTNRSAGGTQVFVQIAMTQHEGDAMVAVGVQPQSVDEIGEFSRLVEGLEHGESA
ncbi:MAG TPA: DUF6517 family protein [Halococcus sp.]|nr:DUF6517 family protein [Halococcus sp.]